ncbi:hypothetical protein [Streptomyces yanii]|uniref:Uncharacterized protein n=1 Tax=Streptomyces yanii TaxID=78510 RepID=A0ABV5R3C8_9ACTN
MASYIVARRGATVGRAAVDALGAAAQALETRPCEHETHPYLTDLEEWDTDADGLLGAPDVQVPITPGRRRRPAPATSPDGPGAPPT